MVTTLLAHSLYALWFVERLTRFLGTEQHVYHTSLVIQLETGIQAVSCDGSVDGQHFQPHIHTIHALACIQEGGRYFPNISWLQFCKAGVAGVEGLAFDVFLE